MVPLFLLFIPLPRLRTKQKCFEGQTTSSVHILVQRRDFFMSSTYIRTCYLPRLCLWVPSGISTLDFLLTPSYSTSPTSCVKYVSLLTHVSGAPTYVLFRPHHVPCLPPHATPHPRSGTSERTQILPHDPILDPGLRKGYGHTPLT